MKNVLVIGSTGQIGSELTMKIRREIPGSTVVAGYIPGAEPKGELLESGPAELADVRNAAQLADIVERYHIDTIYNLAALLSAVAEKKPLLAWDIQMTPEHPRGRPREEVCGLHPQLDRLLRSGNPACGHPAGYHPAPPVDVRRHEGCHGAPERLLLS